MSLRLLSPTALLIGLGALLATLAVLHLLRVRLRRETVDSLLFFRMLGEVQRPRALPGRPARWLAFLLALLATAAAWLASADPRTAPSGTSRVVVLDATRATAGESADTTLRAGFARRAAELARTAGLGDRGRVLAAGPRSGPVTLLAPGEPADLLAERLDDVQAGPPAALWSALRQAAEGLLPGDEIVVLGGGAELPARIGGVPVVRDGAPADDAGRAVAAGALQATIHDHDLEQLHVTHFGARADRPLTLVLTDPNGTELASTTVTDGRSATLGPLPATAQLATLRISSGGVAIDESTVALSDRRVRGVQVAAGLPLAVELAIAADPLFTDATDQPPQLAVTSGRPAADLPSLVLVDTTASPVAIRQPRRTAACPLPLSLRDREREAGALPIRPADGGTWTEVWVEDGASGAPLLARHAGGHVMAVDWLLDDPAFRDVPVLISGALRQIADLHTGENLLVQPGAAPAAAQYDGSGSFDSRDGTPWLPPLLLSLALLILAADTWLFSRGRLP